MPKRNQYGRRHAINITVAEGQDFTLWDAIAPHYGRSGADQWITRVEDNYRVRFQAAMMLQDADEFVVVPMILWCPFCGAQHIDKPEPEIGWTNPPHRSHKCSNCDCVWRPADCNTVGVEKIETVGKDDWVMLGTTAHIFSSDPWKTHR